MSTEEGLVLYLPFEEEGGTVAHDKSGYENDGTVHGGATWVDGKIGYGLSLDGTDDFVSVPDSSSTKNWPNGISVALWAKSETVNWNATGCHASKRNNFMMYPVQGGKNYKWYVYTDDWHVVGSYTIQKSITEWHYYVGTYASDGGRLYFDGELVAGPTDVGSMVEGTKSLEIGKQVNAARYFNGLIDEVRVYNQPLSGDEIKELYWEGTRRVFVDSGKSALAEHLATNDWWTAVGTEKTTVADQATLTALEDELERVSVPSKSVSEVTARLVAVFGANEGCGKWQELGLFDTAPRVVMIDNCDSKTGWASDNTLSLETTHRQEGNAALESEGMADLSFKNTSLSPNYAGHSFTEDDKFQLWYYVADKSNLTGAVQIKLSSSTTANTDEWRFNYETADLVSGWNWFSRALSSGTQVDYPDPNAIVRFELTSGERESMIERIDKIRLFGKRGSLWCRAELDPEKKQIGEVKNVYWYLEVV